MQRKADAFNITATRDLVTQVEEILGATALLGDTWSAASPRNRQQVLKSAAP